MTYKIEAIEGIGTEQTRQLMSFGVFTAKDLLQRCGTVDKLRQLEVATGITADKLTSWMHQADLMRVSGIGPEFGLLLERSGVESVAELAMRKPENVTHLVARVNAEKKLTRAVPALKTVEGWVQRAKSMTDVSAAEPVVRATSSMPASEPATRPDSMMPTSEAPMMATIEPATSKAPVMTSNGRAVTADH